MGKKGYIILENGTVFEGHSFGSENDVKGEVVFNTGMVGYPEGFTDPSYSGQILTLTYPLIGNYGVPEEKYDRNKLPVYLESEKIHIKGLIVTEYIDNIRHWCSVSGLSAWLKKYKIPALSGIDTRTLTKILRKKGVMKGAISFSNPRESAGIIFEDINKHNLAGEVSSKKRTVYGNGKNKIIFIDCGLKASQIKLILKFNTTVIRVPWNYDFLSNEKDIDGIFISNGPGDPKMVGITINNVRKAMDLKKPIFGICLGNQILALAAGADTYKLKYGHRGQNQPVKDQDTGRCFVTTQNHGFSVDSNSLPQHWKPYFINLNDNTNEGIVHSKYPFFSVQFHPESMPGPRDTEWLFEKFVSLINSAKGKK